MSVKRCGWCNVHNPLYVRYHDEEWGVYCEDERTLFELLVLESFQAGLSWECVLNKREAFRKAYDDFDLERVCGYGEEKIGALMEDAAIIRNRRKIEASIRNARIFREIQRSYGSFQAYLRTFCGDEIRCERGKTTNEISDALAADLRARGMRFVGSTILYAYLQAIGRINSHEEDCFLYCGNQRATTDEG